MSFRPLSIHLAEAIETDQEEEEAEEAEESEEGEAPDPSGNLEPVASF